MPANQNCFSRGRKTPESSPLRWRYVLGFALQSVYHNHCQYKMEVHHLTFYKFPTLVLTVNLFPVLETPQCKPRCGSSHFLQTCTPMALGSDRGAVVNVPVPTADLGYNEHLALNLFVCCGNTNYALKIEQHTMLLSHLVV